MLPPQRMLAKKISIYGAIILLALAVVMTGCTPAGPRAVQNGQKYLDHGDYAAAAAQFKTATTLLATNAQVWNCYGVALQGANDPQGAANAYQRALELDRDLVEAHFNLGNLWLDQNQPDAAKTEFMAYTLRRNNDPAGWLKLGSAQLRLSETVAAERSFSSVLALKPGDAEAYNGLGLARVQRGLPRDAVKFFAAAEKAQPDFAAAILNDATVNQQYLRDNRTALAKYREYLALDPRPANWNDVNALANRLEQPQTAAAAPPPAVIETPVVKSNPPAARIVSTASTSRPAVAVKPPVSTKPVVRPPAPASTPVTSAPAQVVQVQPGPEIVTSPRAATATPVKPAAELASARSAAIKAEPPVEPEPKPGLWKTIFGSSKNESARNSPYLEKGLTPLPANLPNVVQESAPPARPAIVPLSSFPRYKYLSSHKPAPGNHANGTPAAAAFTKAQVFEQDEKWSDAMLNYQQAALADPSWFEAQYNAAALAQRLRMFSLAAARYESALAIHPESVDTRYYFAQALKASGYVADAVNEFKKVLAANPNEVRAHLALGTIYATTLHDTASARVHYLKVLELDPQNAQALDIGTWLTANPN
ncbi:MAG TPA: tetratricopeptide repeat protein [Verrucomicrobiae bacterium]|jgi:tetratricopeptide (TPR) repeat protein